MDPAEEENSSADEAAMAAALGFSSFGAQPRPSKKRRVDQPGDNAFIDTPASAAATAPGTGANADPLPPRVARGSDCPDNTDPPLSQFSQNPTPSAQQQEEQHHHKQTQSQSQSRGSVLPHAVASLPPRPPPSLAGPGGGGPDEQAPGPDWSSLNFGGGGRGGRGGGGGEWQASTGGRGRRGGGPRGGGRSFATEAHGRQDPWWVGYYDPSSNQNPWEWLEREKGLETDGEWLPRQAWRGGPATGGVRPGP